MCTVKVTVRLAGSCRRMEGVYSHLEEWVGLAGVLFGDEIFSFVERLYEEMLVWG